MFPSKRKQSINDTENPINTESQSKHVHYGRIISFGKEVAEGDSSEIQRIDFRSKGLVQLQYEEVLTISRHCISSNNYCFVSQQSRTLNMFYQTTWACRLPNAPDMEVYSMYGIGIPTERAYVYKQIPASDCYIPFQIDTSADEEDEDRCLKDGVFTVDGDETVPVLSAGFMSAKGWRGKTRFNPSGLKTYVREYDHAPPANLLEGRGTQSGAHVDIMGKFRFDRGHYEGCCWCYWR
ncbi:UNVERIFIED_CONTAM: Phospholipid:diacylglycerol acyltransferase 1 [Sesamum angustifolium]|uniref:Phospholipid:diacylglycerol acyltransferase 1 n=1 Tax=Sesamum angustifolium TaxID=2727405 RepID=A0AAW2LJY1_9LAMI